MSDAIVVEALLLQMFWDYDAAVLYAISADSQHAALLQTIDPTSGKVEKVISNFPELSAGSNNGASAVFDIKSKVITGSFVDAMTPGLTPYWITMDTQSGNTTSKAVDFYAVNLAQLA